jgi:hypothetical protein
MSEKKVVAFCGIFCSGCPAYKATINDDDKMREEIAEKWTSDEFPLTAKNINCFGCPETDKPVMAFVGSCKARICALEKGVETCAHCDDYACEILQQVWDYVQDDEAKKTLDNIRQNLK